MQSYMSDPEDYSSRTFYAGNGQGGPTGKPPAPDAEAEELGISGETAPVVSKVEEEEPEEGLGSPTGNPPSTDKV